MKGDLELAAFLGRLIASSSVSLNFLGFRVAVVFADGLFGGRPGPAFAVAEGLFGGRPGPAFAVADELFGGRPTRFFCSTSFSGLPTLFFSARFFGGRPAVFLFGAFSGTAEVGSLRTTATVLTGLPRAILTIR
jgi:hypothetical protein